MCGFCISAHRPSISACAEGLAALSTQASTELESVSAVGESALSMVELAVTVLENNGHLNAGP